MLRNFSLSRIIVELISIILIVLWVYTGMQKYLDFTKFSVELSRSPFIENWSKFLSYALPSGELLLALLLVIPKTRLVGLYLSLFTMASFTGYVYIMLIYAPDLPCTCGGIIEKLSWEQHLFVNALLTVLLIIGILLKVKNNSIKSSKLDLLIR